MGRKTLTLQYIITIPAISTNAKASSLVLVYFHPPPPIPHPPQWDDSTLCLPVVILLAHLVFVAGVDHFLGGTGDQLSVLHELSGFGHCSVLTLTLLHKTIKNISIYIINTYIIDSTSPSNCFHNNHLLIYHT